jgi:hypothetical protein
VTPFLAAVNEKQLLEEGYLKIKTTFEILGKPKEHVTETLKTYLDNIKKDSRIEIANTYFGDAEEAEETNGLFSAFAEVDMFVRDTETLTWLAFNFSPASVEVLEPAFMKVEAREMTNWINDLLAQLHELSAVSSRIGDQNKHMVKNMNALIKNLILVVTEGDGLSQKDLEKKVGIPHKQMKPEDH